MSDEEEIDAARGYHETRLAAYQAALAATHAAFHAERAIYLGLGAQHGTRALSSLLTFNGGAVLGYVVLLANLPPGWAARFADLLFCAFVLFAIGFASALISCLIAVLNNQWQDRAALHRRDAGLEQAALFAHTVLSFDKEEAKKNRDAATAAASSWDWWLEASLTASIATGVLSFVSMIAAIIVAAGMFEALDEPLVASPKMNERLGAVERRVERLEQQLELRPPGAPAPPKEIEQ